MTKSARVFKVKEQFRNIVCGAKGFVHLKKNKKNGFMNKPFKERIMLAVTEVNGCSMCSYIHTKIALSSGMTRDQIQAILSGDVSNVPAKEAIAIAFATHFADSNETPSEDTIIRLITEYGFENAESVLAVTNMITMTNGMGISMDDLYHRITFRRRKSSRFLPELVNPFMTMLLFVPMVLGFFVLSAFKTQPQLPKKYTYNN